MVSDLQWRLERKMWYYVIREVISVAELRVSETLRLSRVEGAGVETVMLAKCLPVRSWNLRGGVCHYTTAPPFVAVTCRDLDFSSRGTHLWNLTHNVDFLSEGLATPPPLNKEIFPPKVRENLPFLDVEFASSHWHLCIYHDCGSYTYEIF
jgi:hypothetical protein